MPLNHAQKTAVEYLEGPLLVLAGPGTGKTQLLSAKVQYILEHTDTDPESILCITFTDSGAANMRQRLASMIGRAARKVNIFTYHALGSYLLDQYKNYSSAQERDFSQPIEAVTQWKVLHAIQEQLQPLDILKSANISDIISTIASAKSARLSGYDLEKIAAANISMSAEISAEASPILQKLVPRMKFEAALAEVYRPLQEIFARHASAAPLAPGVEPVANSYLLELSNLIDVELAKPDLGRKPSISPLTSWKKRRFDQNDDGEYYLADKISNLKLSSLAQIMQKYDEHLFKNGLFDFADMIEQAISIIKKDHGFQLTLEERFQYILLDEFQDTNPSQFEIVKLLTDYENPNIMAVGDDDQAIFAFQGANTSNLLDFQNHYQAKLVKLTDNYRSTAEILGLSRKIADQITDSFAHQRQINKNLVSINDAKILQTAPRLLAGQATPSQGPAPSYISRHEFLASDSEYYWVAERIDQLLKAGEQPKDIAIIAPKHKYIAPLLPYLRAHPNIQVSYEKRENILDSIEIYQLSTLARFVFASQTTPPPASYLLEILSFPFWQIPAMSVIQAIDFSPREKKSALELLVESKDQRLIEVAGFLSSLITHSFSASLDLFLGYLVGTVPCDGFTSPFLEFYQKQSTDRAFTVYENLSVLRSHIESYVKTDQPKLADFITFLDDYQAAGEAILNTSPYQDSEDSVQILTAHKSKGLEFKHVFLISVDDLSWGNAKGNNNMLVLPPNLTHIRYTGSTENERLRLFFVALTRAELSLTLTNSIKDFSGKSPNRLEYLDEYTEDGVVYSPYLPARVVCAHYEDFDASKRQYDFRQSWLSAFVAPTPEVKPRLIERLRNYHLTASDLTSFIDIVYAGPLSFYQQRVLRAPAPPADSSILFGNLMHYTFEAMTSKNLSDAAALDYFKEQANRLPLSEAEISQLVEKGIASLQISLPAFSDILRHPHARAEYNFCGTEILAGDVPITGTIDHFNINREQKTIEIYDFKTGNYHEKAWRSHPTLFKYSLQLGFYKLLLNYSPEFHNYTVTRGHILFVTPDHDDKVYDKVYEYNDNDEKYLLSLIDAVYRQIKTLDFLDSPALALEPDADRKLKDILEFIEILQNT